MPTIAEYLKYANLQMAAEALYNFNATLPGTNLTPGAKFVDEIPTGVLTTGNLHASRFTAIEAAKFADPKKGWTVIEHISNTTTGFSGTLFKNNESGELVLSFRSTEFIDDAARDNEATNKLEIKDKGFAFGQLADMEKWYGDLQAAGKITGPLTLTGYSLSGQLATAFNLMHGADTVGGQPLVKQVINFNGAGMGKIEDGSLATTRAKLKPMLDDFASLRTDTSFDPDKIATARTNLLSRFKSDWGRSAYATLNASLFATKGIVPDSAASLHGRGSAIPPVLPAPPKGAYRPNGMADPLPAIALPARSAKTRRWRHADTVATPANDSTWRNAA